MKLCKVCLCEKDENQFHKNQKKCIDCERKHNRERYLKNKDVIIKRSSLYQKTHYKEKRIKIEEWRDKNREKVRAQNRESYQRNKEWYKKRTIDPIKKEARYLLNLAVVTGKIIKPDNCQRCDESKKLSAHHDDYNKPYDVRWLCGKCHKIEDGQRLATFVENKGI